jgi:hypothetical protein
MRQEDVFQFFRCSHPPSPLSLEMSTSVAPSGAPAIAKKMDDRAGGGEKSLNEYEKAVAYLDAQKDMPKGAKEVGDQAGEGKVPLKEYERAVAAYLEVEKTGTSCDIPPSRGMFSAMKSGASKVKSSMLDSFTKVQKRAGGKMGPEDLASVDELVAKLEDTYVSEEAKKRAELLACTLSDFELKATLGTGSFGRVRLVRHTKYHRIYALKMLSKDIVLRSKQVEHITNEKQLLAKISFPFIINLYGSFQDDKYLYLALEYSIGGEFFTHLRRAGKFSNDTTRFFSSQVITALEYLHGQDIIYRDLKPENLLLDAKGNLKVCFCQLLLLSMC